MQNFCGDDTSFMFKFPSPKNRSIEKYERFPNVPGNILYIDDPTSSNLFTLGDISVVKKGTFGASSFQESKFDYRGESLIGNGNIQFTVSRIVVAEMVDP